MGELLLWKAIHERNHSNGVTLGRRQYRKSRLLLLFQIVNVLCETSEYLKSLFVKEFASLCIESEDIEVSEFVLDLVHCLNVEHPYYVKSSLYILDMLEFPESVNSVVQKMDLNTRINTAKSLHGLIDYKIISMFNIFLTRTKCSPIKLFVVFQHFVCLLPYVKLNIQDTLDYFLKWCADNDDMIVAAALGCISMILYHSMDYELKSLDLREFIKTVIEYAAPTATLHERLAVCQLLVHNKKMFCELHDYVKGLYSCPFKNSPN